MKFEPVALVGMAVLALAGAPAHAAAIPGLFNTGVDASGTRFAGDGISDPHYAVNGSGTPVTYKHGAYISATDAYWIAVQPGGSYTVNPNYYTLRFDLSGYDIATAIVSGSFASDNAIAVALNGGVYEFDSSGYAALSTFSFTKGFVQGVNVLTFKVTDYGPPSAFLVSGLHGSAALLPTSSVPEPASWAMLIAGFGLAGAAVRRHGVAIRPANRWRNARARFGDRA